MKKNSLSPRLKTLLECIENCQVLADIGTDHAYLPIKAIRQNICKRAVACDIAAGPLKTAAENIGEAGLSARIETRLGDGLFPLAPNEADCIVIAGMGGKRIIDILSAAWEKIHGARLILQPQHDLEELRRFLHANSYNIKERLAREDMRFYVILAARREEKIAPYTDAEYFTGKISSPDFPPYLREQHRIISGYINSVTDETTRKIAQQKLRWIEEIF